MSDKPESSNPNPPADPFANLPPMGTMQIGSPVSGNLPTTEPLPTATPTPDPAPAPTPAPDPNTKIAKNKSQKIVIIVVSAIFCILGAIFGSFLVKQLFMDDKSMTCTASYVEDGITVNTEIHLKFSKNQVISSNNRDELTFPYAVTNQMLKEYDKAAQQLADSGGENTTSKITTSLKDKYTILIESSYEYKAGMSYQETMNYIKGLSDNTAPITCKDD